MKNRHVQEDPYCHEGCYHNTAINANIPKMQVLSQTELLEYVRQCLMKHNETIGTRKFFAAILGVPEDTLISLFDPYKVIQCPQSKTLYKLTESPADGNGPSDGVWLRREGPPPDLPPTKGFWLHVYNPPPKVKEDVRVYDVHVECDFCGQFTRGREDFHRTVWCDSCRRPLT